jgi:hypothetical protein
MSHRSETDRRTTPLSGNRREISRESWTAKDGHNLLCARVGAGLALEDLAKALHIPAEAIRSAERGEIADEHCNIIAGFLAMKGTDRPKPPKPDPYQFCASLEDRGHMIWALSSMLSDMEYLADVYVKKGGEDPHSALAKALGDDFPNYYVVALGLIQQQALGLESSGWMVESEARSKGARQVIESLLGADHGLADDVLARLLDGKAPDAVAVAGLIPRLVRRAAKDACENGLRALRDTQGAVAEALAG